MTNCACGLCPSSVRCLTCGLPGCDCPQLPALVPVDLVAPWRDGGSLDGWDVPALIKLCDDTIAAIKATS
jgi:hypothetical protein